MIDNKTRFITDNKEKSLVYNIFSLPDKMSQHFLHKKTKIWTQKLSLCATACNEIAIWNV